MGQRHSWYMSQQPQPAVVYFFQPGALFGTEKVIFCCDFTHFLVHFCRAKIIWRCPKIERYQVLSAFQSAPKTLTYSKLNAFYLKFHNAMNHTTVQLTVQRHFVACSLWSRVAFLSSQHYWSKASVVVLIEDLRMQHLSNIVGGVPFSSRWTFKHRESLSKVQ